MATTENWIRENIIKDSKQRAKKAVAETNAKHEGMKQIPIPHPTLRKTFILKFVKDENK